MCWLYLLLTALYLATTASQPQLAEPTVSVELGRVRGHTLYTILDRPFYAFEGIPYAQPPVGDRRFKEPQSLAERWVGVWDATRPGSDCMQYDLLSDPEMDPILGEEDCLYLNVYTPKLPSHSESFSPMDVFVHIHGGGFTCGAGHHDMPSYLLDRDVVFVSVNYRLGPLGFLSTEDDVVPGNNGLKDQVVALQWVQRNIDVFGGNANSVTITGVSAGGASVHYHYMSPWTDGLFHKGISTSGSALCPWTLTEDAATKARTLASALGCPTTSSLDMVNCLKTRPARRTVQVATSPLFMPWNSNPFTPFGPVVEKGGASPYLSQHPWEILQSGQQKSLPWLASVTSEEGLYPVGSYVANATLLEEIERDWLKIAPELLDYSYTVDPARKDETSMRIKEYYMKGQPISRATTAPFIQMVSDRLFVADIERAARLQAAVGTAPVYFYRFSYRGKHSLSEFMTRGSKENFGVSHADDAGYVMRISVLKDPETKDDHRMREVMVNMWVTFAKTGVPVFEEADWTPVSPAAGLTGSLDHLHVTSPWGSRRESCSDLGHRAFWVTLPLDEISNLQDSIESCTGL